MGRFAQLIVGPAGAGKSTYCLTMQRHFQAIKRPALMINLDPAAEKFHYRPDIDIRDLITLEDVMEELQLGPNGGLVFCMEYLLDNLDWLEESIGTEWEDEYIIIDCPGQIELFTHSDTMKSLITFLQERMHFYLCAVYLLESQFIVDTPKFFSGVLTAISAMVRLEVPHVNVLTKMDLIEGRPGEILPVVKKAPKKSSRGGNRFPARHGLEVIEEEDEEERDGSQDPLSMNVGDPDDPKEGTANTFTEEEEFERDRRRDIVQLDRYLDPNPSMLLEKIKNSGKNDKWQGLNEALVHLIEEFDMVSFLPLNIHDEESIETVLYSVDLATQFGEDQEPKEPRGDDDEDETHEDIVEKSWRSALE